MLDPITESLENWAIPERRNVGPYMLTLQNQYLNENILHGGAGKSGKCTFCVKYFVSYGFIHADPQGTRVLLYWENLTSQFLSGLLLIISVHPVLCQLAVQKLKLCHQM